MQLENKFVWSSDQIELISNKDNRNMEGTKSSLDQENNFTKDNKMNPEASTIVGNIKSLMAQLEQLLTGEDDSTGQTPDSSLSLQDVEKILKEYVSGKEPTTDPGTQNQNPSDKPPTSEVDKSVTPASTSTEADADGTTGSSSASDLMDEGTDENDKNINEVAKMIVKAFSNKAVKKSAPATSPNVDDKIINILTALAEENKVLKKGLENLYEGFGIADEIKKANQTMEAKKNLPENDPNEIKKSLDEVRALIGDVKEQTAKPAENVSLRKSLTENNGAALTSFFRGNLK